MGMFFFEKLLSLRQTTDKEGEELTSLISVNLTEDAHAAVQISLFPSLLPPTCRIRTKERHWKPTIAECRESILTHIRTPSDLKETIKTKNITWDRIGVPNY